MATYLKQNERKELNVLMNDSRTAVRRPLFEEFKSIGVVQASRVQQEEKALS